MNTRKEKPTSAATLKVGWWVALTLKPGTAPLHSYVGQIQSIDGRGIRITLIDWLFGRATGWDLFVPKSNIESALVCTENHDLESFGDAAGRWQSRMDDKRKQSSKTAPPEAPGAGSLESRPD